MPPLLRRFNVPTEPRGLRAGQLTQNANDGARADMRSPIACQEAAYMQLRVAQVSVVMYHCCIESTEATYRQSD